MFKSEIDIEKQMKSSQDFKVQDHFADQVMDRIYRGQAELSKAPKWMGFLFDVVFYKYALFSLFLLFPIFARTSEIVL